MTIIYRDNTYMGFVTFLGRKYCFEIKVEDESFNKASFKLDWKLINQLGESLSSFLKETEYVNPVQFYNKFSEFVKSCDKNDNKDSWFVNPLKTCSFVKTLKDEMENSGEFIKNINLETGIVEVEVTDSQLRNHKAVLKLSRCYPREPLKIISHDLPLHKVDLYENNYDLNTFFTIAEFCKKFSQLVNNFQEFWNTVSLVDVQCCVLDPPHPTFKDIQRRIKITDTLSVILTFNPMSPKHRPNMKLLGCQSDVNHYRAILQKNLQDEVWDCEEDILYNLSNVLEVTLPNKIFNEDEDLLESPKADEECAICFTWRLEGEIPNEICDNGVCKSLYHTVCLFTYLSSLPRNRDYFGKIQGECPNCNHFISCSVPDFS